MVQMPDFDIRDSISCLLKRMDSTPDRTYNSIQTEFQLQRIYMLKIPKHDTQSFLLSLTAFQRLMNLKYRFGSFVSEWENAVLNVRWT